MLLFVSILFHICATVLFKFGALHIETFNIKAVITNYYYVFSLFCLAMQAVFWQLGLKKYPLSTAYLVTSIYYPMVLSISYLVFHETVTAANICGTLFIAAGVIFVMRKK